MTYHLMPRPGFELTLESCTSLRDLISGRSTAPLPAWCKKLNFSSVQMKSFQQGVDLSDKEFSSWPCFQVTGNKNLFGPFHFGCLGHIGLTNWSKIKMLVSFFQQLNRDCTKAVSLYLLRPHIRYFVTSSLVVGQVIILLMQNNNNK